MVGIAGTHTNCSALQGPAGQGMIPRRTEQQGPMGEAGARRKAPETQERAAVDCPAGGAAGSAWTLPQ
eukprot:jgi/Botrbrau1/14264/Bobra.113_2s0010.1